MRQLPNPSGNGHAVNANGLVTSSALGIEAEDFAIIPPNQDLYCTAFVDHKILKVSRSLLTNYVGDLLITQEGLQPNFCSRLFHCEMGSDELRL